MQGEPVWWDRKKHYDTVWWVKEIVRSQVERNWKKLDTRYLEQSAELGFQSKHFRKASEGFEQESEM